MVASLAVHYNDVLPLVTNPSCQLKEQVQDELQGKVSGRPDFTIFAYPVITMKSEWTYLSGQTALFGDMNEVSQELFDFYCPG